MKKALFLLALLASQLLFAQVPEVRPVDQDTLPPLPFELSAVKRLSDEDIVNKKEGFYVTGLPRFEFDPIRGIGVGGNLFLFHNQDKQDPFFYYTPYRHQINLEFFVFQNGRIRYAINYDAPYIFNSKWRFRAAAAHTEDPNSQYWGIGRGNCLRPLTFRDKRTGQIRVFRTVHEYEENLALAELGQDGRYYTDFHHHHILQNERLYNILLERMYMQGRLRAMFGYEANFSKFSTYNGQIAEKAFLPDGTEVEAINNPTRLDLEQADGTWERFGLTGAFGSYALTSIIAGALIYDTRDLEPDPSHGVFLQYSHEVTAPWLGSAFNFQKMMVQGQVFHTFAKWRGRRSRLTFAGMMAFGNTWGPKTNFIELWDLSSQAEAGGILALGGGRSIRGFRETRFVAPSVGLVNLELRSRLYDFNWLNQHFALGLVPFYDVGTIWDSPRQITLSGWRGAPGLGGRIAWNQATVLRIDYGHSREGGQFFFGFGHIF